MSKSVVYGFIYISIASHATLTKIAKNAKIDPSLWLEQIQYYGDLKTNEEFSKSFSFWLNMIWNEGIEATISLYLEEIEVS